MSIQDYWKKRAKIKQVLKAAEDDAGPDIGETQDIAQDGEKYISAFMEEETVSQTVLDKPKKGREDTKDYLLSVLGQSQSDLKASQTKQRALNYANRRMHDQPLRQLGFDFSGYERRTLGLTSDFQDMESSQFVVEFFPKEEHSYKNGGHSSTMEEMEGSREVGDMDIDTRPKHAKMGGNTAQRQEQPVLSYLGAPILGVGLSSKKDLPYQDLVKEMMKEVPLTGSPVHKAAVRRQELVEQRKTHERKTKQRAAYMQKWLPKTAT